MFPHIKSLKHAQFSAIKKCLLKHDVLGLLPTGSGKTEIFLSVPEIINQLLTNSEDHAVAIAVVPLVNLAEEELQRARAAGLGAEHSHKITDLAKFFQNKSNRLGLTNRFCSLS